MKVLVLKTSKQMIFEEGAWNTTEIRTGETSHTKKAEIHGFVIVNQIEQPRKNWLFKPFNENGDLVLNAQFVDEFLRLPQFLECVKMHNLEFSTCNDISHFFFD